MKNTIIIFALLLFPAGAKAQLDLFGDAIAVKQLAQEILIYGQDVLIAGTTGKTAISTTNTAATTAKALILATQLSQAISTARYQGLRGLLWQAPYLLQRDRYGLATPWTKAATGHGAAVQAYQIATIPVPPGDWPAYYASASPVQQQRIAAEYAWLQDTDAENAAALGAIGDSSMSIPTGLVAVNNLTTDNFEMGFVATNPQLSQIALMQKQNIGTTMGVNVQIQNQQLLAHILHELILMNTRERNEEAKKLNSDQLVHAQTAQAAQSVSGLTSVLNSIHY